MKTQTVGSKTSASEHPWRQDRLGDTCFLDEVFVTINGEREYLWRAVDQVGGVIDILAQSRRNRRAAERFFRKALEGSRKGSF